MYTYNNKIVGIPARLLYEEWNLMPYTTYEQYIQERILIETDKKEEENDEKVLSFHLLPEDIKQFCITKLGEPTGKGTQDELTPLRQSASSTKNHLAHNHLLDSKLYQNQSHDIRPILNRLIQYLVKEHKLDLLYLIKSKITAEKIELLVLIISPAIKPYTEEVLNTHIQKHTRNKRITITCLLHNSRWIKRHAAKFFPFIQQYITTKHLAYSRTENLHTQFILPLSKLNNSQNSTDWHLPFWETCQHTIEHQWTQMNVLPHSTYNLNHIGPFRSIFQLLCLNILYKEMNYIPHLDDPNYLWQLVAWANLELSKKLIASSNLENTLSLLSKKESYFPRASTEIYTPMQSHFQDTLIILNALYNHVKPLYTPLHS